MDAAAQPAVDNRPTTESIEATGTYQAVAYLTRGRRAHHRRARRAAAALCSTMCGRLLGPRRAEGERALGALAPARCLIAGWRQERPGSRDPRQRGRRRRAAMAQ